MKKQCMMIQALAMASLSFGAITYIGGGTDAADWHDAANWDGGVPGASDDAYINKSSYAGDVSTTAEVSLNSFLFKNGNQLVTIGNDFSTVGTFDILANYGGQSSITIQNAGTVVDVGGDARFTVLNSGNLYQSWRVTLKSGTTMNVAGGLTLATTTASPNYYQLMFYNAAMNVTGDFSMTENGTSDLRMTFQNWAGSLTVGGAATLAGDLIVADGLALTDEQYGLIHCTSANLLAGGFDNVTFGSTTYTNSIGDLYRLDQVALDGDGINNDIVLNQIPEPTTMGLLIISSIGLFVSRRLFR